jgi:hypothetical protein
VQAEIKELMRLLDQKRKEEEELSKQINGLERNVVQVTDRFKNEMERIGIEREAIAKDDYKYTLQMVRARRLGCVELSRDSHAHARDLQEELKKAKRRLKSEEAKDRQAEKRFHDALAAIETELASEQSAIVALEQKEDEQRRTQAKYEAFVRMEADQEEQVRALGRAHTTPTTSALTSKCVRVRSLCCPAVVGARANVGVQRGHHTAHRSRALSPAV